MLIVVGGMRNMPFLCRKPRRWRAEAAAGWLNDRYAIVVIADRLSYARRCA